MNKTDAIKQAFRALNTPVRCDCNPESGAGHVYNCIFWDLSDAADALLEAFPEECAEALEEDEPEF